MNATQQFKSLKSFTYIIAILVSVFFIITVNYFALKTLNGVRSFISGESRFAKGQLEASRYLTLYIYSGNEKYFKQFQQNLNVPIGDSLARVSMDKNQPDSLTMIYLAQGKNNELDSREIIWIYKNFKSFAPFQKSVKVWSKADQKIMELQQVGNKIREAIQSGTLSEPHRQVYVDEVNNLSEELVRLGYEFDKGISDNLRQINVFALWSINTIALLIIIGNIYYFYRHIRTLSILKEKTLVQNDILRQLNSEMDLFSYSVSHDLRSPITSMKGLLHLAQSEKEHKNVQQYFNLMQLTLDRQDLFIQNIINLTKHKRSETEIIDINLEQLINQVLNDIYYMTDTTKVNIYKELEVKELKSDLFRMKIILNNLLSNAFKYLDPEKPFLNIGISSKIIDDGIQITIQDNGIGIKPEHHAKIFSMFYVVNHKSKGTGLGLYLVKETVKAIGGRIEMKSEAGFGTSFNIYLPTDTDNASSN